MTKNEIVAYYESRFIPRKYWNLSFKDFENDALDNNYADIIHQLKNYSDKKMFLYGYGVLLYGSYRTGKTALSVATLKYIFKIYKKLFYFIPAYLFYEIFFDDKETYYLLRDQEFIILDDFGREYKKKEFSSETVENFLRYRINKDKGTLITSNLNLGQLSEIYGDAFYCLIEEMFQVKINVPDTSVFTTITKRRGLQNE